MDVESIDVLIIGGGLTGASLLLALQGSPWTCRMIESRAFGARPASQLDARSLALSPSSKRILSALGLEDFLSAQASDIQRIHVSQQGKFGNCCLRAKLEPLGCVIELHRLTERIVNALDSASILIPASLVRIDASQQIADVSQQGSVRKIKYKILVAADGAQSRVRSLFEIPCSTVDYQQSAIIANLALKRAHDNTAYERFTHQGPLAMLPLLGRRMALVWAMAPEVAKQMMALGETDFLQQLQRAFGYRLGRLQSVGVRQCFPLHKVEAQRCVEGAVVCIGSAAQHLHPVAGQGFNLALRDVASLAQCLQTDGLGLEALQKYNNMRQADRRAIGRFTDGLLRLFGLALPGVGALRGAGLVAFDNTPLLQETLTTVARGFAGTPPNLACGISLTGESDGG